MPLKDASIGHNMAEGRRPLSFPFYGITLRSFLFCVIVCVSGVFSHLFLDEKSWADRQNAGADNASGQVSVAHNEEAAEGNPDNYASPAAETSNVTVGTLFSGMPINPNLQNLGQSGASAEDIIKQYEQALSLNKDISYREYGGVGRMISKEGTPLGEVIRQMILRQAGRKGIVVFAVFNKVFLTARYGDKDEDIRNQFTLGSRLIESNAQLDQVEQIISDMKTDLDDFILRMIDKQDERPGVIVLGMFSGMPLLARFGDKSSDIRKQYCESSDLNSENFQN